MRGKNVWSVVAGVGVGATLMYLFDGESGSRRRSLVRDKTVRVARRSGNGLRVASRRVSNRARGLAASVRSSLRRLEVSDDVLRDRVRSVLGHLVPHPSAIEVTIEDGGVVLRGALADGQADRLLSKVARMRGVKSVQNLLDVTA